ncbi:MULTISPECIES: formate dehydrogenase accessory sulfurtransferase FdhD [unclassified Achromobacter]|uniref:formate dehydrogenase accessory sulfurtransferase FdhD n=1 Tax=unclassified Achromobacter TaxID=2626865 RepID=UPI000B51DB30|nr:MULTISPECIES: formate dehydrogenase accessory sulfurtransferase FdhD [unclassified Achromobacter]OWT75375.1 sulfurtransferase FdhD [Achromobacter sp. HZ28]OWT76035.1 sulfurtransferase FdhD [Achromobacter sp. HZ34]
MDIDSQAHPTWHSAQVLRVRGGRLQPAPQSDRLAEETPIALEFNGISHATMLATPADLEDFALGFSLTEGIVASAHDVRGIELREECDGIVVEVEISSACAARLKERRRAMSGRTGCGLCGVETLPEVVRDVAPVAAAAALPLAAVLAAMQALRERQPLHNATGATHAAAWADVDGQLRYVREDVGRHNALDKLVGALARADVDAAQRAGSLIVVSSRASFEMVQKTAAAGVGMLAAVSAPTALAQRLSRRLGVGLMGFMRGDDATLYACPERIAG